MWKIYKVTTFEAAHRLEGHPKCGKLHGHSYKLEVWADSSTLEKKFGFVMDFHWISDVAKKYDHSDIVLDKSCEELAQTIAKQLVDKARDNGCDLSKLTVRLWETASSYAEFQC